MQEDVLTLPSCGLLTISILYFPAIHENVLTFSGLRWGSGNYGGWLSRLCSILRSGVRLITKDFEGWKASLFFKPTRTAIKCNYIYATWVLETLPWFQGHGSLPLPSCMPTAPCFHWALPCLCWLSSLPTMLFFLDPCNFQYSRETEICRCF